MLTDLPIDLRWLDDKPLVTLGKIASEQFQIPFWDDALTAARVTRVINLDDAPSPSNGVNLAGTIYHLTRCGSTALLQQFGALPDTFPVSEPFIFLKLLNRPCDSALKSERLRKLLFLFQTALTPVASGLVVKWPTLMCRHVAAIEHALPEAPAIFLYRDPVEILASVEAAPLGQMENLPAELSCGPEGIAIGATHNTSLAKTAAMLAANCRWIERASNVRRLDYNCLPDAGWTVVAPHFGFELSALDRQAMMAASMRDAKKPDRIFVTDSAAKREQASPQVHALAAELLAPALASATAALLALSGS